MDVPAPPTRLLRFGTFEADLRAQELRKRGMRVRLPHQVFQVLQVLIENPGRVVAREELQRTLWPADTFVEFDRGLNNAISRLRDLLGDSVTSPRFIETIPRRGYRFIAPVESVEPAGLRDVAAPAPPEPPSPAPAPVVLAGRPARRRWFLAAGAAVLAILSAGLAYQLAIGRRPATRSLAVLPLTYRGAPNQPAQDYLADGMTDALIAELSRLGSLRVISETSSRRYKGTTRSLPEIARELGVDTIVEGSVLREGNVIRVTVQLIRADIDSHMWAQTYTRGLGNVLTLHNDVALDIAHEIGARITPQEQTRIAGARPIDPEAYRLYVLGQRLRQKWTEPELYAALDHFQQAVAIEPEYARAYWGIAETWIALAGWAAYLPPREGFPKARAAAEKALAIDELFAEAHATIAFVSEAYDWDLEAAERSYQRALTLSPSDAYAHQRYSLHLYRTGRPREGLQEAQRAYELNPLSLDNNIGLAMRLFSGGQQDEGIATMLRAVELDPTHFEPWLHLGEAYARMGRGQEALAAAQRAVDLSNRGAHAVHMLALIHGQLGRRAEAEALLQPFENSSRRNAYDLGMFHLALGNTDRALRWLLTACQERTPPMAFFRFVQGGKQFDPLRRDARFTELVRCAR